jgi:NDP-sugar pyrophosphorylase family protein
MLNIVIPMAGRGSRFVKEGFTDPKPLIPIGDKRMIEVVINNLKPKCEHKFIFICQQEHIEQYDLIGKLSHWAPGCEIIGIDGVTDGAACTVLCAEKYIDNDQPLMIANSDQWIDIDIDDYLAKMTQDNLDGLIMTMTANDPKWSFVELDGDDLVTRVVEKEVISFEATVGIYNYKHGADFCRYAHEMISNDDRANNEFYVAPVYNYMYQNNKSRIGIYNIGAEADGMYGLGIPSDLALFNGLPAFAKAINF